MDANNKQDYTIQNESICSMRSDFLYLSWDIREFVKMQEYSTQNSNLPGN